MHLGYSNPGVGSGQSGQLPLLTRPETDAVFAALRSDRANQVCFDCQGPGATWTSIPLGIYICLECSGQHRALGVRMSFVKSTKLDAWSWDQIRMMKVAGNRAATDFFRACGAPGATGMQSAPGKPNQSAMAKYSNPVASLWRDRVKELAEHDARLHPGKVEIPGLQSAISPEGSNPNAPEEDFFASATASKQSGGAGAPVNLSQFNDLSSDDIFSSPGKPSTGPALVLGPRKVQGGNNSGILRVSSSSSTRGRMVQSSSSDAGASGSTGPSASASAVKRVSNVASFNFDEIEERARKQEENDAIAAEQAAAAAAAASQSIGGSSFSNQFQQQQNTLGSGFEDANSNIPGNFGAFRSKAAEIDVTAVAKKHKEEVVTAAAAAVASGQAAAPGSDRLGMGRGRLLPSALLEQTSQSIRQTQPKSYGSEQLGRQGGSGATNPVDPETQERLNRFAGSTSVSSAQFFADQNAQHAGGQLSPSATTSRGYPFSAGSSAAGASSGPTLAEAFEDGAMFLARKVANSASLEFSSLRNMATEAASRLQSSITDMQSRGTYYNLNNNNSNNNNNNSGSSPDNRNNRNNNNTYPGGFY